MSCYIDDNIEISTGQTVGQRELHESFRLWYNEVYGDRKIPKLTELDDIMTKKFGTKHIHSKKWINVRVKYDNTVKSAMEDN